MASLLLAGAIAGSSYFLAKSIDRGSETLQELAEALDALPSAARGEPSARAARPARPDPNRRYEVALAGAPSRGPQDAAVTIVGWADFQ